MSAVQVNARDDGGTGSWANETLPMSVRKDMLERELKKMGFRKQGSRGASSHEGGVAQQQQEPGGDHPEAGRDPGDQADRAE